MSDKTVPKTWGEFKAAVEAAGLKDADQIRYIDWDAYWVPEVRRSAGEDGLRTVTIE